MKTVALVETNAAGHHRTYYAAFVAALLENGARVVPFCPWPEELPELVAAEGAGGGGKLEPATACWWPEGNHIRPACLRPVLCTVEHFRRLDRALREWEKRNGEKVDLVFFASIYDLQFSRWRWGQRFFRRPWAGLYMDSRAARKPGTRLPYSGTMPCPQEIFAVKGLTSLSTLDEGITEKLGTWTDGRPVVWFPDVADVRSAAAGADDGGLGGKMRSFAAGRKMVGCIGHLQKTKGILNLVRAASDPRLADVCFAFVGEVSLYPHTPAEQREILDAWEKNPRIFCHLLRVPDGPRLNSAVEACDVIAAAYTDFPNSSNVLTKAAAFGKPIIVSDGYLMAERVREFGLGGVVPEGGHEALVAELVRLTRDGSAAPPARSREFLAMHSRDSLRGAFARVLAAIPDAGRRHG